MTESALPHWGHGDLVQVTWPENGGVSQWTGRIVGERMGPGGAKPHRIEGATVTVIEPGFPQRIMLGVPADPAAEREFAAAWAKALELEPGLIWILPDGNVDVVEAEVVEDDPPAIVDVPVDAAREAGL